MKKRLCECCKEKKNIKKFIYSHFDNYIYCIHEYVKCDVEKILTIHFY